MTSNQRHINVFVTSLRHIDVNVKLVYDVGSTSHSRRCDVMTSYRRKCDVVSMHVVLNEYEITPCRVLTPG